MASGGARDSPFSPKRGCDGFVHEIGASRKKKTIDAQKKTHNQFKISLQEKNSKKVFFFLSIALTGCIPSGR